MSRSHLNTTEALSIAANKASTIIFNITHDRTTNADWGAHTFWFCPAKSEVLGYYTISSGYVTFDTVPEKLPRYPIPVVHLGRLAVDLRMQGRGAGKMLLVDALRRSVRVSEYLGIYAVEVRALHERARSFYLKYGFASLQDDPSHLYLPLKTLRKTGLL